MNDHDMPTAATGFGLNEPFEIVDGYTRVKVSVRRMTLGEIKALSGHAKIIANDGTLRNVKINGTVKTWKTRPNEVSGGVFTADSGHLSRFRRAESHLSVSA